MRLDGYVTLQIVVIECVSDFSLASAYLSIVCLFTCLYNLLCLPKWRINFVIIWTLGHFVLQQNLALL